MEGIGKVGRRVYEVCDEGQGKGMMVVIIMKRLRR